MVRYARAPMLILIAVTLLLPMTAFADDEIPEGMTATEYADLQHAASLDTDDLYDGQEVTKEEFAANLAALDVAMNVTFQDHAPRVFTDHAPGGPEAASRFLTYILRSANSPLH